MEGILIKKPMNSEYGIVDTRNDNYGKIRVYFNAIPTELVAGSTISFDVVTSKKGYKYAKFIKIEERNEAIFNTEDREKWYEWGEHYEDDFISKVAPLIQLDIIKNPAKGTSPWEIDLFDRTNNKYADLKTQNTPFFFAGIKYKYDGIPYDPSMTVTFNKKDYENYQKNHPDCYIYFWVNWTQLSYKSIVVKLIKGVWRAEFSKIADIINDNKVALHKYMHRCNDEHNAKESYLLNLNDTEVFEKLI